MQNIGPSRQGIIQRPSGSTTCGHREWRVAQTDASPYLRCACGAQRDSYETLSPRDCSSASSCTGVWYERKPEETADVRSPLPCLPPRRGEGVNSLVEAGKMARAEWVYPNAV